jgi:hypothetical protein
VHTSSFGIGAVMLSASGGYTISVWAVVSLSLGCLIVAGPVENRARDHLVVR